MYTYIYTYVLQGFRDLLIEVKGDVPSIKKVAQGVQLSVRDKVLLAQMRLLLDDQRRENSGMDV